MSRFEARPGKRQRVPIWIGLFGPPGSGKTFSALRLATGIARQTGGKIFVVDTEGRRALHYADDFAFSHVDMAAPFGSKDYLEAARYCVAQGATIIIIDSFSHEHEGPGGYLNSHDAELDRLAGTDYAKRAATNLLAWAKPASARQEMVNTLAQIGVHFICCFRAKEKVKPVRSQKTGRTEIVELGWQPISGIELLYSMTLNMLLRPRSGGVPSWQTDYEAERLMMKLPRQFEPLFAVPRPLDEAHGVAIAQWAAGAPIAPSEQREIPAAHTTADEGEQLTIADNALAEAAATGMHALQQAWSALPTSVKALLKKRLDDHHKPIASKIDAATAGT